MADVMSIAKVQTDDRNVNQLQNNIISGVNPVLKNPLVNGNILTSVLLNSGNNTVNHKLNRKLQGWFLVRQRAPADVSDNQDNNQNQDTTLVLVASAEVTVDLYVF